MNIILDKKLHDIMICVLGAGHGGLAMAGHIGLMGYRVNLFDRNRQRIGPVAVRGGIRVEGKIQGFGKCELASANIEDCLEGVDILMVTVPTVEQRSIAHMCAPFLREHQIVVLHPGRTGGALEFLHTLREKGLKGYPIIAETQAFLYTSRVLGPAHAVIYSVKNSVPLASLPAFSTKAAIEVIRQIFPQFIAAEHVLRTSLDNVGAVFHPALAVLTASWIEETHGDFHYYHQGVSASISRILEEIDRERLRVAAALGINATSAKDWLYTAYGAKGVNLYEAIHASSGYIGVKTPSRLQHRYLDEDVPMTMVPLASLGEMLNVGTPVIRAIIQLASIMRGCDFWEKGRTVERMGLRGLSVREIRSIITEGEKTA